jgi:hypothetical protein
MIDSDYVLEAIWNAREILYSNDSKSHLSKLHAICRELQSSPTERHATCGVNSDGRRELAEYEEIWTELRDSLEPDQWEDERLSPKRAEALRALLLLAQYIFAGQPNNFYINNGGNGHLYYTF